MKGNMGLRTIVTLLPLALAACGMASGGPVLKTRTPSPAELPPTRVASGTDKPAGAAIIYERSGGLTGISEQWTIYPDGRILSGQGSKYRVPSERVSSLLREIESLGFFELQVADSRFNPCRDCFTYRITVSNAGQVRTVTAVDSAPETPAELQQILERVRDFVTSLEQES